MSTEHISKRNILRKIQTGELSTAEAARLLKSTAQKGPNATILSQPSDVVKVKHNDALEIAIVGVSGRFPSAANTEEYWANLCDGRDCIGEIPDTRWSMDGFYDPDPKIDDRSHCKWGGFLDDIDCFDSLFFNISPKEAEIMDPQQRLFLQEAWRAIENAGYSAQQLDGSDCAVYVAHGDGDYKGLLKAEHASQDANFFTGNSASILAARISYLLNLRGPSVTVDTACSSSLVALHLACESLRSGASSMAIAGGVSLTTTPDLYILASNTSMLSPQGRCKAFDDSANGFVPAEGVGVVLLKPLKNALADGDNIQAVIRSSGINQDGATNGITAPNSLSQRDLELEVYRKADISPSTISYVEAHGTGTILGDPIEVQALTESFRRYTDEKQFCAIGSVKSNIGHAQLAAGMMSLIKVVLCMQHQALPPSIHYHKKNHHIDFDNSPFYVNTDLCPWQPPDGVPRRAVISAFGFSGTNAHVLLEEPPTIEAEPGRNDAPLYLIPLSAKTEAELKCVLQELLLWLQEHGDDYALHDIAYTLLLGRTQHFVRTVLLVRDKQDLLAQLQMLVEDGRDLVVSNLKSHTVNHAQSDIQTINQRLQEFVSGGGAHDLTSLLGELADRYLDGYALRWERLFPQKGVRVPLPGYPFARTRHWVANRVQKDDIRCTELLHPLVHLNSSTLYEQRFSSTFTGQEYFFADHIVGGKKMLPGVAYLEMARAAVAFSSPEPVARFRNIIWANPVEAEPGAVTNVHIKLMPEKEGIAFQVFSESPDNNRILHSQGSVECCPDDTAESSLPPDRDIASIRQRCGQIKNQQQHYAVFQQNGVDHGTRMQAVRNLQIGNREALADLELPVELQSGVDTCQLPPAILDAALQSAIGVAESAGVANENGTVYLPFSLGSLSLHRPVTQKCYAYATAAAGGRAEADTFYYDIDLLDEHGTVLLEIRDFSMRALVRADQGAKTLYFVPEWQRESLDRSWQGGSVLVMDLRGSRVDLMDRCHDALGSSSVTWISPGATFAANSENHWRMDFDQPIQYGELVEYACANNVALTRILVLLGDASLEASSDAPWQRVFGGIFWLTRSLLIRQRNSSSADASDLTPGLDSTTQILTLYADTDTRTCCINRALEGYARSAFLENSKLILRTVGIGGVESLDAVLTDPDRWKSVLAEFAEQSNRDAAVVLTPADRRVKRLKPVELGDFRDTGRPEENAVLKDRGVYLITGGMGGIGFGVAKYLAKHNRARLTLVGRSALTDEIQLKLDTLRKLGAEAIYLSCDVSDKTDAEKAVEKTFSEFGELHGVLHIAGVNQDAFIWQKRKGDIAPVIGPKVGGSLALDQATRNVMLDCFILFGSNTADLGNPGQVDYSFANSFMNYFAEWRMRQCEAGARHGRTLCINWPLWEGGGMGIDRQTLAMFKQTVGLEPMSFSQGLNALEVMTQAQAPVYTLIRGDRNKILQRFVGAVSGQTGSENVSPSKAPGTTTPLVKRLQDDIADIVSSLMNIERKDVLLGKEMGEYGFNSLTLTELSNAINRRFDLSILPSIFFEYPTLEALAFHLAEAHGENLDIPGGLSARGGEQAVAESKQTRVLEPRFRALALPQSHVDSGSAEKRGRALDDIAIIGIAGTMPQSKSLQDFWRHLMEQDDLVTEIPADRWDWKAVWGDPRNEQGKTNIKWGAFIDDVDKFDAFFFNISAREAELMDPQQRLFLHTVWHVIEDAGYRASALSGTRMGVFAGVSTSDYTALLTKNGVQIDAYTSTGMAHSVLANRVSHFFNFTGPSEPIDTACSSALVAMNRAVEAIHSGSCDTAIAGGVNVMVSEEMFIGFSKAGMLSPDGRSKTFDASANGYARGEGVGAVFLKPLAKAEADGDHIYAVIRGIEVNHGGRANSLTAPNPNAQADLIASAVEHADVDPTTIGYMEAHGTGTSLGDPVEINGLKKAFKRLYTSFGCDQVGHHRVGVGSVKTNLGHLEAAAGVAGVFKVLLAMQHRILPGNVHFRQLNPMIQLEGSPLYIVDKTRAWPAPEDDNGNRLPRRAGVSSFGFGGANAHVLLEEYVSPETEKDIPCEPLLFVLSARDEERLLGYATSLARFIREQRKRQFVATQMDVADNAGARAEVLDVLTAQVARLLDVAPADLEAEVPMQEYGLDDHNLISLSQHLSDLYDVSVSLHGVIKVSTSLGELADYLLENHPNSVVMHHQGGTADGVLAEGDLPYADLRNIAFTLHQGREPMQVRLAVVAKTDAELLTRLDEYCATKGSANTSSGIYCAESGVREATSALLSDDTGSGFIDGLLRQKALDKLASIWVSGVDIDWSEFYDDCAAERIPIPTYPFAPDRYWVPGVDPVGSLAGSDNDAYTAADTDTLHPLIDARSTTSEHVRYGKQLLFGEFFIKDHCIAGTNILPGVGFIEMAFAAMAIESGAQARVIRNLMWAAPIEVGQDGKQVYIELQQESDKETAKFDIFSMAGDRRVAHSNGRVSSAQIASTEKDYLAPAQFHLEELIHGCPGTRHHQQVYEDFARGGFAYGPSLQVIETIHSAAEYSVSKLVLPGHLTKHFDQFVLHPSLMDGALQTIMGIGDETAKQEEDVYIPFVVEKLELLKPLETEIYVYARFAAGGNTKNKGVRKFDVSLLNEAGEELVRFRNFTSRAIPQAKSAQTGQNKAVADSFDAQGEEALQLFHEVWQPQPLQAETPESQECVLVFADRISAQQLSQQWSQPVVRVSAGSQFERADAENYSIHPGRPEDYAQLIQTLRSDGKLPAALVHMWMYESPLPSGLDPDTLQAALHRGLYSVVHLFKALTDYTSEPERQRLLLVLPGSTDIVAPHYDLVKGLINSTAQLNHRVEVMSLHLPAEGSSESLNRDIARLVHNELFTAENRHKADICYQEQQRFVRRIQELSVDAGSAGVPLRQQGHYLVTGGLGSIGQMFVRELCQRFQANVLITGRSARTKEVDRVLESLQANAGKVEYVQADVANQADIESLRKYIQSEWGRLNGILHIAGIVDDVVITQSDIDTFERTLRPKVHGVVNLDSLARSFDLDCFVLFSSISSVIGDFGGCSYAAANHFMDRFAEYRQSLRNEGRCSGHTVSIAWPLWAGGSMELPPDEAARYFEYSGMRPLAVESGLEAFHHVLARDNNQVVVAVGDAAKIRRLLGVQHDDRDTSGVVEVSRTDQQSSTNDARASMFASPEESVHTVNHEEQRGGVSSMEAPGVSHETLVKHTEVYLKKLMAQATKIPEHKIDPKVDLEKYGIDSILIMDLNNLLEAQFSELPRTLFFEYSNLHSLAGYFIEEHGEKLQQVLGLDKVEPAKTAAPPTEASGTPPKAVPSSPGLPESGSPGGKPHIRFTGNGSGESPAEYTTDIAVIGMAGRFPKAKNIQEFWENLQQGRDCIEEIPEARWDYHDYYDKEPNSLGKSISKWGGFINDIDRFDPQFFGITPAIAMTLDPQERLFLETAWEVIEDAGYTPASLTQTCYGEPGNDIGVFVGIMYDDYKIIEAEQAMKGSLAMSTYWNSTLANRVSYQFNYQGPSVVVDTACSSSLVAVHQACESLRTGECRVAIAGGVSLSIHPNKYNRLSFVGMLASDGRCRSFGEGGTGYVPGEGVGAVLLKPLAAAEADGDRILAVVKGSTTNHGGKTNGFSVPNPNAQGQLIAKALKKTGINPRTISYVEAHGTGTALGDPIEIAGLNKSFRPYTRDNQFCAIGSVKSNIGHCEGAAGIAAVAKSVLQLDHRQLVPSLHSAELNSNINFEKSPFFVQQTLSSWQQPVVDIDGHSQVCKRTSGISSFGAGGTNVHVIMQEYEDQRQVVTSQQEVLFLLSAKNDERLRALAKRWLGYIQSEDVLSPLFDVACTLQTGRVHMNERLATVVDSWEALSVKLNAYLQGELAIDDFHLANIEEQTSSFGDDEEDLAYMTSLAANKRWRKLAKFWLAGSDIDFDAIYSDARPIKVTGLPTYPFAREVHWLPIVEDGPGNPPAPATPPMGSGKTSPPSSAPAPSAPAPAAAVSNVAPAPVSNLSASRVNDSVGEESIAPPSQTDRQALRGKTVAVLKEMLADVIRLPIAEVSEKRDFYEFGMDSISINQFAKVVNGRFADVSETALFSYQSIGDLADHMMETYGEMLQREFAGDDLSAPVSEVPAVDIGSTTPEPGPAADSPVSDTSAALAGLPEGNTVSISDEDLKQSVLEFLTDELHAASPETGRVSSEDNLAALGIDSIRIKRFIKRVSRKVPGISDTAMYAFQTLSECAAFLVQSNPGFLRGCVNSGAIPAVHKYDAQAGHTGQATPGVTDIAIIGINMRTAGTDTQEELWDYLLRGKIAITDSPMHRWSFDEYFSEQKVPGKAYCKWGSFFQDYKAFDPIFFGIPPFEAQIMDPQERVFLQSCWHAMEDAGYTRASLSRNNDVGVFAGVTTPSHNLVGFEQQVAGSDVFTGLSFGSIANRVSFLLNLTGPSMPVDTMCSSSLVAIHLACESLRRGECQMAFAGGVNLYLHPSRIVDLCRTNLLSSDHVNSSFIQGGDGFVPAEAVGAVLLKPLDAAIRDGDHIYGLIKGSAVGHSGRTAAYFSPNPASQVSVIEHALANAGMSAGDIDYVEAHAIGSEITDAIELEALHHGYSTEQRANPLKVGSIKPNIGHAESASGMTQLAKVLLQLSHRRFLPTLVQGESNSKFDFERNRVEVQSHDEQWTKSTGKRRAAISSFGAGGTSAHLVVEEYVPDARAVASGLAGESGSPSLVALSAKNRDALVQKCEQLIRYLSGSSGSEGGGSNLTVRLDDPQINLQDIAYTLLAGRETMEQRLAVVCSDKRDLFNKLQSFVNAESVDGVFQNFDGKTAAIHDDSAVAALLKGKHFGVLAQLWVNGMDIDWQSLFERGQFQRLPLPAYPFDKRECWPDTLGNLPAITTGETMEKLQQRPLTGERKTPDEPVIPDGKREQETTQVTLPNANSNSLSRKRNGVAKWKNGMRPFISLSITEFLQTHGIFTDGEALALDEIATRLGVRAENVAVLQYALGLLHNSDLISLTDGKYKASRALSANIKEEIRTLESHMQRLFRAVPEFEPIIRYFKHCCDNYHHVLGDRSAAASKILLPSDEKLADQVDHLLVGQHRISRIADEFITRALERHFPVSDGQEAVGYRILEIGAGGLASSFAIFNYFDRASASGLSYCLAETASAVDARRCEIVKARYPEVTITRIADADTLDGSEFDVVVLHSSGALHEIEKRIVDNLHRFITSKSLVFAGEPLENEIFPLTLGVLDDRWAFGARENVLANDFIIDQLPDHGFYADRRFYPWLSILSKTLAPVLELPVDRPEAEEQLRQDIERKLLNIMCEQLGYQESDLQADTDLRQLGINSIMQAMLLIRLQETFGRALTAESMADCVTVQQMAEVIVGLTNHPSTQVPAQTERASLLSDTELTRNTFNSSRGQTIEYFTVGQGRPILFLTALAFSKNIWEYQVEAFRDEYQLIFPHLPGHAGSSYHGSIFTFDDLADDLAELLDHMEIASVHMVGWCMAGNVAQIFGLRHPDRLDSLCLLCTTPTDARTRGMGSGILTDYSNDPLEAYELEFQNIYQNDYFDNAEISEYLDIIQHAHAPVETHALACLLNNLFQFNTQARLKDLSMPVLVVCGRWDIAFPPDQVRLLAENITDAKYLEFDNGGHLPFLNQAGQFNQSFADFLRIFDAKDNKPKMLNTQS